MPVYFVHLSNQLSPIVDKEGLEFANEAVVVQYAISYIRHFIINCILNDDIVDLESHIVIQDVTGSELHRVHFQDVIKFTPPAIGSPKKNERAP
jgi:hypothetical protein